MNELHKYLAIDPTMPIDIVKVEPMKVMDYFLDDVAWETALTNVNTLFKMLSSYKGISNKTKSEIVSGIIAEEICKVLNEKYELAYYFRTADSDNDPDIIVEEAMVQLPQRVGVVEVKVSKCSPDTKGNYSTIWRGGELSKRDGDYLFVSWDYTDDGIGFFVCHAFVKKEDWQSNLANGYYATSIPCEKVIDKHMTEVIIGSLSVSAKGNSRFKLQQF